MLRKMINSFKNYVEKISLMQKIIAYYSIFIVLPLGVAFILMSNKLTSILENNIYFSATQHFEQSHSFLTYKFYKVIKVSDIIFVDSKLHEINKKNNGKYDIIDQIDDMNTLQLYLTSFEDKEDILNVKLYVPDGLIYSDENVHLFNRENIYQTIWYQKLIEDEYNLLFCPSEYLDDININSSKILSIARRITKVDDYSQTEGFLRIDIDKQKVADIVSNANPLEYSYSYITNSEDVLVVSSDPAINKDLILKKPDIVFTTKAKDFTNYDINGNEVYVNSRLIPNTDWYLTTVIPFNQINSEVNSNKTILITIAVILILSGYFFSYSLSKIIINRVNQLIFSMQSVQLGIFTPMPNSRNKDEIGVLVDTYNYMLHKITELMREEYDANLAAKNSELKAIQAQINPHFLYNTLEMINWMAKKQKTEDILSVTKALSNFYKLSLSKGMDFISIRSELQHVSCYVDIQNMRFDSKIVFNISAEKELLDFLVPKIILQPIVENAIMHGILEKGEDRGHLDIKIHQMNECIYIEVTDDGIGIPSEKLKNILDPNPHLQLSKSGSHYALKNIYQRLKLTFGEECDMYFSSELLVGTTVTIKIPLSCFGNININV